MFFTFFKLCKCYQIAQSITNCPSLTYFDSTRITLSSTYQKKETQKGKHKNLLFQRAWKLNCFSLSRWNQFTSFRPFIPAEDRNITEPTCICGALSDLVSFVQFEKRENTHGGVLLSANVQVSACNLTKITLVHGCFSRFLKLYKCHQIAQNITYMI